MNYLELVQKAMERGGVRTATPSTLSGAIDITADFTRWVNDTWRELQEESRNWWFRQKLDQTTALSDGDDEYPFPADLETINFRTVSVYETAKTDEAPVTWVPYEEWRMAKDTISTSERRPQLITERPDGVLQVWPVPDQAYTLRYDGVWDIDEMSVDADEPGSTITGGTRLLPTRYEWVLVWGALARFYEHHENGEGLATAMAKFKAQRARMSERQMPPVYVKPGILTGTSGRKRRYW